MLNTSEFGPFKSVLAEDFIQDDADQSAQARAEARVHWELDGHLYHDGNYRHDLAIDSSREYSAEADELSHWEKQGNYTKRLAKNQYWSLNAWNHINPNFVGPLNIDPEVLSILFEPEPEDYWQDQFVNDAYDMAIDTVDDEDFGSKVQIGISYQVRSTKRWKAKQECDESGKLVTSCFDKEKYNAHVKSARKIRANWDCPELLDKSGAERHSGNRAWRTKEMLKHLNAHISGTPIVHVVPTKEEKIAAKLAALDAKRAAKK